MREAMAQAGLSSPRIRQTNLFTIVFKRLTSEERTEIDLSVETKTTSKVEKGVEKLGDGLGEKLGKTRSRIVFLMAKNAKTTIPELAEMIGITTTAIENHIRILKNNGVVKRIGPAKGGYWEVVERK
jgi:ATP-dependent DNA helicase RecG